MGEIFRKKFNQLLFFLPRLKFAVSFHKPNKEREFLYTDNVVENLFSETHEILIRC